MVQVSGARAGKFLQTSTTQYHIVLPSVPLEPTHRPVRRTAALGNRPRRTSQPQAGAKEQGGYLLESVWIAGHTTVLTRIELVWPQLNHPA